MNKLEEGTDPKIAAQRNQKIYQLGKELKDFSTKQTALNDSPPKGLEVDFVLPLSQLEEQQQQRGQPPTKSELEIVVELENQVPRKNLVSQKVSLVLRYLQS